MSAVFVLCALFPAFALAATHYVTPSGTGSQNGSDWNNAYRGLPGSLTRGDTYVVAGGNYSSRTYGDAQSGTTVTYVRKASSLPAYEDDLVAGWNPAYETAQAVFSGQTTFTTGYYSIDGVTPTSGHWQTSGYGIKFIASTTGVSHLVTTGSSGVSNITIKHVEMQNPGASYNSEQFTIVPQNSSATYDSWTISHCYLHDSQVYIKLQCYAPRGWIIEHNYIASNWSSSSNHGEQISFVGLGSSTPHQVRYNWFEPYAGTGSLIYLWYMSRTANDVAIYGNVWHNAGASNLGNGVIGTGDTGESGLAYNNWKIYNNTFIGGRAQLAIGYGSPAPTGWEIKNNLFYNCTTQYMFGAPNGVIANNYRNNSPWGWGTCTNCVTSTESSSALFPSAGSGDYHLGSGSQAVNAGATLTAGFAADADGVSRPQGGAWDMGAFEYGTGRTAVLPMPPTLRVN